MKRSSSTQIQDNTSFYAASSLWRVYIDSSNYFSFILKKIKNADAWQLVNALYKQIRKYTFISGIIRAIYYAVLLLEKSALLLLSLSLLILVTPILFALALIYFAACVYRIAKNFKEISLWLSQAKKITVYVTESKIFNCESKLFLRSASLEASEYTHPVIVICADRFVSLKWHGLNLLALRSGTFFFIKRYFLSKRKGIINYIVIL